MLSIQLGLTKIYNLFHCKQIVDCNQNSENNVINNLEEHLKKNKVEYSLKEAVDGILQLRTLHKEMDQLVLQAYGWTDINLSHDFYEVDYLPENDRIRYSISPGARKEILKRLLKLNHEIHEQEEKDSHSVKTKTKQKKKKDQPGQKNLFDELKLTKTKGDMDNIATKRYL